MACNERCPFCNVPAEDYPSRPTPEGELSAAIVDFVAAGEQTLTISGGEPTLLRRRLVALVAEARAAGLPFVELQTNAVLLDEGYATELAEAGLSSAFVSLLSDLPEHHDALAGLKGAFERCLHGVRALLDAGVSVTLNPVVALQTQDRVADYVDFVARQLPGVRHISLSAVQPHGRGASNLDLLPDYAVLGPSVRQARERARAHGITLLNPFCGLPLCVGWEEGVSVEAEHRETGPGLENEGNKSHGAPCVHCTHRPACPGAWHAVWTHRGGSGLAPVAEKRAPWAGGALSQGAVRWGLSADAEGVTDVALRFSRTALAFGRRDVALTIGIFGGGEEAALQATKLALEVAERVEIDGHEALVEKLRRAGLPVRST